jgi:hypothetical protein
MSDWSITRTLLFALALLVAPAMAVWDGWTYIQLTSEGATARALVTARTTQRNRSSTSYYVHYSFRDSYGRSWSGSQSIGQERYENLVSGQRIDIVYSQSKPDVNVAYLEVLRERVANFSFFSFVIALITGGFAWWWHYAQTKTREYDAAMRQRHPQSLTTSA